MDLPHGTKIHKVFHASLLTKYHGDKPVSVQLPLLNDEGEFVPQPLPVLARRMKKKHNKPVTEVLIQWKDNNPEDAVWRELHQMQLQFPDFDRNR